MTDPVRGGYRRIDRSEAETAVLSAFNDARRNGQAAKDCYKAGVDAWRALFPEQAAEYAAKTAVAVMLASIKDDMLTVDPEEEQRRPTKWRADNAAEAAGLRTRPHAARPIPPRPPIA